MSVGSSVSYKLHQITLSARCINREGSLSILRNSVGFGSCCRRVVVKNIRNNKKPNWKINVFFCYESEAAHSTSCTFFILGHWWVESEGTVSHAGWDCVWSSCSYGGREVVKRLTVSMQSNRKTERKTGDKTGTSLSAIVYFCFSSTQAQLESKNNHWKHWEKSWQLFWCVIEVLLKNIHIIDHGLLSHLYPVVCVKSFNCRKGGGENSEVTKIKRIESMSKCTSSTEWCVVVCVCVWEEELENKTSVALSRSFPCRPAKDC